MKPGRNTPCPCGSGKKFKHCCAVQKSASMPSPSPDEINAYGNLGNSLQAQGKLEEAKKCYQKVLQLNPNHAVAYNNLGNILATQNQLKEAIVCYQNALRIDPDFAKAHYNLGNVFLTQQKYEEAEPCYRRAILLNPGLADAYSHLGDALQTQGRFGEAKDSFQQALTLNPNEAGIQVKLATLIPVIMNSSQEIIEYRTQLENRLTALLNSDIRMAEIAGANNFYIAYHGLNDKEFQIKLAAFYEQAAPFLSYTAPHCEPGHRKSHHSGKMKIGWVSNNFKNHVVGNIIKGIIAHLSKDKFQNVVFFLTSELDDVSTFIQKHAEHSEILPLDLTLARQQIAKQQLDILIYPNIGEDPFAYFLAFARLAPVQCTTWGFPLTTGIRNMDYFISAKDIEVAEQRDGGECVAQEHYSEKLVRLNHLPVFFYKPKLSSVKYRRDFGLTYPHPVLGTEYQRHLYLCPQSLPKFHPEFDPILVNILRNDPEGQLVLIEGHYNHWTQRLKQRFSQTLPDVMTRITFLPRMNFEDYLHLLALADVMLDPLHFGGGVTTSDALALGTPVVTLPSRFMQGRATYYFYRKMGMLDCVAENPQQYVEIALRLGTDPAYRERVKTKILASHQVLYENLEAVRELEEWFETFS